MFTSRLLLIIVLFKPFWFKDKYRIEWNYIARYTTPGMHDCPWYLWQFEHCSGFTGILFTSILFTITQLEKTILITKINMHTWCKLLFNTLSGIQQCWMTCIRRKNQVGVALCFFSFSTNTRRRKKTESFISWFFLLNK